MNIKSECCKYQQHSLPLENGKTGNGFVYLKEFFGLAEAF